MFDSVGNSVISAGDMLKRASKLNIKFFCDGVVQ